MRHSERDDSDNGGGDDDDDLMEEDPQVDRSMKHAIIVHGLPTVPAEKKDKLLNVLRKFFSAFGTIIDNGLEMPFDDQGKTSLG